MLNRTLSRHLSLSALAALLFVLAASPAAAQKVIPAPEAQASPTMLAAKKLDDDTYVKITYSSPRRRDPKTNQNREIFGKLIPFGEVWRLGANAATEITTTGDIEIAGKRLPAGTYALFAVPQRDKWTLVVNKDLGQWGAYSYKQESDLFRVDVPVTRSDDTYDAFSINFDEKGTALTMAWENTQVTIPVRTGKKA